jgi:hypothetical protein
MADSFLEEQVRRIRALTERMSQVEQQRRCAEEAAAFARQSSGFGPLHDVRDVRVVNSPMSERSSVRPLSHRRRRRR